MSTYPGAIAFSDQDDNILYVLRRGHVVRFAGSTTNLAMPHHVQIRATGRHVSENLHLQIAYTVVMGEPMLRFYDSSMHGTFVQSTQRQTLYVDNCNPLHEYANAVRHIRGSDNVNNVRVSELHLNRFLGPEQSRIMLGELHSSVWFAISDANEMFYAACLQGQTLRAHQLQYSQIASSLFFSRLGVLDSMITAVIRGNNFKLLKLCFKYWDCPTTMDHLLLAIRMAHVDVFKLVWQHRSKTCAYDTQTMLKTAAAWHNVPVILYLGTYGIAAKRNNVVRFQRQTTSVVCKLAIKLCAGPERLVDCSSKYVLAFLCIQEFPLAAITGALNKGKWPACSKLNCDTCSTLARAMEISPQAFLQFLDNEFTMYPMLYTEQLHYDVCKDYISSIVKPRGYLNRDSFKWFSKAGKRGLFAFFLANQRLRSCGGESLPAELHYKIASFTSHADWNTAF